MTVPVPTHIGVNRVGLVFGTVGGGARHAPDIARLSGQNTIVPPARLGPALVRSAPVPTHIGVNRVGLVLGTAGGGTRHALKTIAAQPIIAGRKTGVNTTLEISVSESKHS